MRHPLPIPPFHSSTFPPADSSASAMSCWGLARVFLKQDHWGSGAETAPPSEPTPSHPALKKRLPLGKQWAQQGSHQKSLSPALKPQPDTISYQKKSYRDLLGTHLHLCVHRMLTAQLLSHVRLYATPWNVAHQAPLSMEFSRQEYWSGLPFPSPGDLLPPGIEPASPALAGRFFTTEPPEKPLLLSHFSRVRLCATP